MLTKRFQIKLDVGLHARPAAAFVQLCNRFDSEIIIKRDYAPVNAKSIIGVMALGVADGDEIDLVIDGSDEVDALETIAHFLEEKIQLI